MTALQLSRVTVHPDGALVTRHGSARATSGRIVLTELPLLLDPGSVRVSVQGGCLTDVRLDLDLVGASRVGSDASTAALEAARDALAALQDATAALDAERRSLTHLVPTPVDDPEADLPSPERLARWPMVEADLSAWATELDTRLRVMRRDEELLFERVHTLTAETQQQSSEAWWRRWAPTRRAVLHVVGEGELQVQLSYRIPGATWSPAYALDADAGYRSGRFTMRALVVQRTGEDWRGVELAVSTAPCSRGVDLPELPALKLGTRQPPPAPAWRELPAGLDTLFPDDLPVVRPPPNPRKRKASAPPPQAVPANVAGDDVDVDRVDLEMSESMEVEQQDMPMRTGTRRRSAGLARFLPGMPTQRNAGDSASMARDEAPVAAPAGTVAPARSRPATITTSTVDYAALWLAGWQASPSTRGRLQPLDDRRRLETAGLPSAAVDRLRKARHLAHESATAVVAQPLPPHHVLPGPVGGSDYRWPTSGQCDVPSDGRFHSVAVYSVPVSLEITYRAVPRHDRRTFRRLDAALDAPGPLLGGPVDVFVDGALELTTPWEGTPGRGRLQLGLGVEDRLSLARNVRYREESAGLFGGSRRIHTTVEVQVASALPHAVQLEVLEGVPVAADSDEVEIAITASTPQAEPWAGERDGPILEGARRQSLEVGPGAQARAVLSYTVTIANKQELVGGDRRGG